MLTVLTVNKIAYFWIEVFIQVISHFSSVEIVRWKSLPKRKRAEVGHLVEGFRVFYHLLLVKYFVKVDEVE